MAGASETIVRLRIEGRVQGVGFRFWAIEEAGRHGLRGWVRNRADGSVEALLAGPAAAVEAMLAACWRGPRHARVANVAVTPAEDATLPAQPAGFVQRPTA